MVYELEMRMLVTSPNSLLLVTECIRYSNRYWLQVRRFLLV